MEITKKKSLIIYFILFYISAILNGLFFNYLNNEFFHYSNNSNDLSDFSSFTKFCLIVIISPIVETFLFQYLPNVFLTKLNLINTKALIIIPSLLFAAFHFYFWLYACMALVGGLLINSLYVITKGKTKYYILIIIAYHSLYNLFGYLFIN